MNARLFCLIVDPQGRYRVSCREQDLDRTRPREYFGSFDAAYCACRKINAYGAARRSSHLTRTRRDSG